MPAFPFGRVANCCIYFLTPPTKRPHHLTGVRQSSYFLMCSVRVRWSQRSHHGEWIWSFRGPTIDRWSQLSRDPRETPAFPSHRPWELHLHVERNRLQPGWRGKRHLLLAMQVWLLLGKSHHQEWIFGSSRTSSTLLRSQRRCRSTQDRGSRSAQQDEDESREGSNDVLGL